MAETTAPYTTEETAQYLYKGGWATKAERDQMIAAAQMPEGAELHEPAPSVAPAPDPTPRDALADRATIVGFSLYEGIMAARQELRQAQIDLDFAIGLRVGAKHREDRAKAECDKALALATADLYEAGLGGSNEKARQADLDARLYNRPEVTAARDELRHATNARIEAEGRERAADTKHKALRAEIAALGNLAGN